MKISLNWLREFVDLPETPEGLRPVLREYCLDCHGGGQAEAGVDLDGVLREHRSSQALLELGDAVRLEPTGTNVNDLFVLVIDQLEAL